MPILPYQTRAYSYGETSFQNRNSRDGYAEQIKLFKQADTVNLVEIARHYRVDFSTYNKVIQCPFKGHNDRTPSFHYYPDSNTFFCFGCKNWGGPVQFVTLIEGINRSQAAHKLLAGFNSTDVTQHENNVSERNNLYFQFSELIYNFLREHLHDPVALQVAKDMCLSFDTLTGNHKGLEIEGLQLIIQKIKQRLEKYSTAIKG